MSYLPNYIDVLDLSTLRFAKDQSSTIEIPVLGRLFTLTMLWMGRGQVYYFTLRNEENERLRAGLMVETMLIEAKGEMSEPEGRDLRIVLSPKVAGTPAKPSTLDRNFVIMVAVGDFPP